MKLLFSDKDPALYCQHLVEQCHGGPKKYGGITSLTDMQANFEQHCIPAELLNGTLKDYEEFLAGRGNLMAGKMRDYFDSL